MRRLRGFFSPVRLQKLSPLRGRKRMVPVTSTPAGTCLQKLSPLRGRKQYALHIQYGRLKPVYKNLPQLGDGNASIHVCGCLSLRCLQKLSPFRGRKLYLPFHKYASSLVYKSYPRLGDGNVLNLGIVYQSSSFTKAIPV